MELLAFRDAAQWESWLAAHHAIRSGVWLKIAKHGSGRPSVTPAEAVEVALCYGWIDGQRKSHDGVNFLQKYLPRRRGSSWSRINVERVEALIAAGRMRPPGLAEIEAAKADGRWDAAYESQRTATVPADLAAALARDESARAFFESLGADRPVRRDPAAVEGAKPGQPGGPAENAGRPPAGRPAGQLTSCGRGKQPMRPPLG